MELIYKFGRGNFRNIKSGNERQWMIGNGIGGYSSHTIIGGGFTSFHSYLTASLNPPVERYAVFTRTQEQVIIGEEEYDLTSQEYVNYSKNGHEYIQRFIFDSVPQYIYQVKDINIKKTIAMEYGHNTVVICYEIQGGTEKCRLNIVPLFNFKAAGELSEKSQLNFKKELDEDKGILRLTPNAKKDVTITLFTSEGEFKDRSLRPCNMATPNYIIEENHFYGFDNRNGSMGLDNHYTPYDILIDINSFEHKCFYIKCTVEELDSKDGFAIAEDYKKRAVMLMDKSECNDNLSLNLVKAADHFIVKRNSTGLKTILAGFPWFTDWGRDTMIAFEGLTLCTKRFEEAREILLSFSKYVKNGLVPNVFPDKDSAPGYNTADASLWYIHAIYMYLKYTGQKEDFDFVKDKLFHKMTEIIEAYKNGTDFSIKMDSDGLIMAGDDLDQITWMDVRVGDKVMTPRHGKPVEINALWYNALCIMAELSSMYNLEEAPYNKLAAKVKESFNNKFWNSKEQCLFDVVDKNDDSIRPNQIFAVSLPFTMPDKCMSKKIVDRVYRDLYGTYGLRSLNPQNAEYKAQYIGKLFDRDSAYHMGTVWAYLIGAFITAYCKVNDYSIEALEKADAMCEVFEDHMKDGCINGIAEIFDGDFSSTGRGCFSQAWSVAELLRARRTVNKYKKDKI